MTEKLARFIEEHINIIESNNFEYLYDLYDTGFNEVAPLTDALYSAGIDPLPYMDYVPHGFARDTYGKQYNIPDSINNIYAYAFYGNGLTKINIPSSVKSIGSYAFAFSNLEEIDTADATSIGADCFETCLQLKKVRCNAKIIMQYAFKDCVELEEIYLGKGVEEIRFGVFNHCPATEIHYEGTTKEWENIQIGDKWSDVSLSKIICSDGEVLL